MSSSIYVAIPVYNGGKTIRHTLHNLAKQTYADFQILIYDDGSTDRTAEIIKNIAKDDPRITVFSGQKNQGRGAARNHLIEAAGDGLIAWQDADDTWRPNKLAEQLAFHDGLLTRGIDPGRAIVLSTFDRITLRGDEDYVETLIPPSRFDLPYILSDAYGRCPFQLQATLGFASVYRNAGGFDPDLDWSEDLDIALKIVTSGGQIVSHRAEHGLAHYHHSLVAVNGDVVFRAQQVIANKFRDIAMQNGIDLDDVIKRRRLNYLFNIYLSNGAFSKAIFATLSTVIDADEKRLRNVSRNLATVFRCMLEAYDQGEDISG